jgi:hypothetical protein
VRPFIGAGVGGLHQERKFNFNKSFNNFIANLEIPVIVAAGANIGNSLSLNARWQRTDNATFYSVGVSYFPKLKK